MFTFELALALERNRSSSTRSAPLAWANAEHAVVFPAERLEARWSTGVWEDERFSTAPSISDLCSDSLDECSGDATLHRGARENALPAVESLSKVVGGCFFAERDPNCGQGSFATDHRIEYGRRLGGARTAG
jgi:hypothetical protein